MRKTTPEEARSAWAEYVRFDGPLLMVTDANRARALLMKAFGIAAGEPVGIPVNSRRYLSEAVKRVGGKPRFLELDTDLAYAPMTAAWDGIRLAWAQPTGGMAVPRPVADAMLFVDHGLTLPAPLQEHGSGLVGAATIFGLHLDAAGQGALIAFNDRVLAARVQELLEPGDLPNFDLAMAQCARLQGDDGLAARLLTVEREVRLGMESGAGMPMAARADGALPYGVPVRIPVEVDVATFISYVRNEQVSLDWLPEIQPMFYWAYQVTRDPMLTRQSAEHLARWVIAPIGPDFVDDEITHAVLGVLKAAEYTGGRWYTDPGRARWYSDLLIEWYGQDHDAYHPAFEITVPAQE